MFKLNLRLKNTFAFIIIIALILVAGFRDGTGTDTNSYKMIWQAISPLDQLLTDGREVYVYLEPGFFLSVIFCVAFLSPTRYF